VACLKTLFGFSTEGLRETSPNFGWDSRFCGQNSITKGRNNSVDYQYVGFEIFTALSMALCFLSCSLHLLLWRLKRRILLKCRQISIRIQGTISQKTVIIISVDLFVDLMPMSLLQSLFIVGNDAIIGCLYVLFQFKVRKVTVLSELPAQRLRFESDTCGVHGRCLVKQESLKLKSHYAILFLHILCFKSYSNCSRLIN
jgi:hypothetical protein